VNTVFLAGLALLALAAAVDLLLGGAYARLRGLPYLLGTAASACLLAAGAGRLAGHPAAIGLGDVPPLGAAGLAIDPLSALFLVIAFGAAVGVSPAFASRARRPGHPVRRGLGAAYALTLGATAVIVTARDIFTFLFAWEALTVAFYLLTGHERHRAGRAPAALGTLAFGKISGAALLLGMLLLAATAHRFSLAAFAAVPPGAVRAAAYALLVLGFATKIGLVPVHVWLPRGYAAAPGPARALMGGVAVNVGFYGLWRTLDLLGPPPAWLVIVVLVLAAVTAVLGIAHAAVQTDLHRVIAYSSVENAGLILAGFGVAATGMLTGERPLLAVGLLAATLQVAAHAAAKSLLFTTASGIEDAGGTSDLDRLRGAARRAPYSGTGFTIGALTLAGLPITAGFVSEWFILESLMQQFRVPGLAFRLTLALTGAAVALTAGFAGVTFVRLVGLVVLGPAPRTPPPAPDYRPAGRAGIIWLSAACLGIAAAAPLAIRLIAAGLAPIVPAATTESALKSPWVLQPVYADFSILSPSWLWVAMPALLALTIAATWLASGSRMWRVRRVPAWRSATAGVEGTDEYTAFGYANPTRRVLANVLHTRTDLHEHPGQAPAALHYTSDVIEIVEDYLYRPFIRPVRATVRTAKRLQSGRLDAYLAYMLIALIAVLALITATG
jgi:formate hydrogenlyase subunit 3/multisubunit Na+/H+ antiporter MnhD subunit